tara:strand:- start:5696 stop:6163 length:468 start_codon:yes stop_codon:yes gene_type:complete
MTEYLGFYKNGEAKIPYTVINGNISYKSCYIERYDKQRLGNSDFLIPGYKLITRLTMASLNYYNQLIDEENNRYNITDCFIADLFNSGLTKGDTIILMTIKKGAEIRHSLVDAHKYNEIKDKLKPLDSIIKDQKKINLLRAAGLSESIISKKLEK